VIFTACPKCERTDFPSRAARDSHVYRCKKNSKSCSPKSIRAEPVKIQDTEKITHPFSDEWDCAVCLHRFSSLEAAREHYKTRHIDKVPYSETNQKENQVEKQVNVQDLLNEMARRKAAELSQMRFAPREGIVQQQLFSEPQQEPQIVEPREQAPIVESEPRQESERPQSTAVYDFFKRLGDIFKGRNNQQVSKEPKPELNQIYMASRGVGVDGLNIAFNPKNNYCKNDRIWLFDIEVKQHTDLGHIVERYD
jgi:hypothetical protein